MSPAADASPTMPGAAVREANFGNHMDFFAPGLKRWQTSEWRPENPRRFMPISVTGGSCVLQCDHCEAKVLKGMISARSGDELMAVARRLKSEGTDGILVSGGSGRDGGVPMEGHLDAIARIRSELGMKIVVHSGVVSPKIAAGLAAAGVDAVMLDIIGADETIRDVYHLDLTVDDFDRALGLLAAAGLRIIPHIVLGMHYGRFLGEHRALEVIAAHPVSTLILVVLVPLVGTPMEHIPPPPVPEVVDFFALARATMPTTTINLGCGRPMGETKVALDRAAIDHGLNGIAYPAEGAIAYAESLGLEARLYEYCCSLTWTGAAQQSYREVSVAVGSRA